MGIRYSINLYYRIDRLEYVLLKLSTIADLEPGAVTTIELPNNHHISLPFTSGFKNSSLKLCSRSAGIELDTCLFFAIDDPIRDFIRAHKWEHKLNRRRNRISIGYIYLSIQAGESYVKLSFTAATSCMSRLFIESEEIQSQFIKLMNSTDSLFGAIDIEQDNYLLLTDLSRKIARPDIDEEIESSNLTTNSTKIINIDRD
jgi:hypothetical protein